MFGDKFSLGSLMKNAQKVQEMIKAVIGHFGKIDILVNNVGVSGKPGLPLPHFC